MHPSVNMYPRGNSFLATVHIKKKGRTAVNVRGHSISGPVPKYQSFRHMSVRGSSTFALQPTPRSQAEKRYGVGQTS